MQPHTTQSTLDQQNSHPDKPVLKTIVSVTRDWAIGAGNDLLIYNPKDMAYFKEHTTGHIVVMGWNTLCSLPSQKPLPKRRNIVLYDNVAFTQEMAAERGFEVVHSLDELFEILKSDDPTGLIETDTAWSIGGAMLYRTLLPYCDEALVTMNDVEMREQADAFFPNLLENKNWQLTHEIDGGTISLSDQSATDHTYSFQTYKNRAPQPW